MNTHNLLNAWAYQRDTFNERIREEAERKVCTEHKADRWADTYSAASVVTCPIIASRKPMHCLGQKGEVPVAIPEAFFRVVIKENATQLGHPPTVCTCRGP